MRKACKNERIGKGVRTGEIISERNEANLASVANARSNKVTFRGHQFEPCTPSMHTVLPDDAHREETSIQWSVPGTIDYALVRASHPMITGSVSCVTSHFFFFPSIRVGFSRISSQVPVSDLDE